MAKTKERRRCGFMVPKKGYLLVKSLLRSKPPVKSKKKRFKPPVESGFTMEEAKKQICESDLILQKMILVRLPVESLLRFKSACKSWCSLIESSSFIHLHTTTFNSSSSSSNKFGSFILVSLVEPEPCKTEYSLVKLSPAAEFNDDDDDDEHHQLVLKFERLGALKRIIGSCNGLICLFDKDVHRFSIWNPATKQHRILPKPIGFGVYQPRYIYGFGFDLKTKDYKVVLITAFPPQYYRSISPIECVCRIQVYSLSIDSWRVVEGITCLPGDPFLYPREVQYVNGSCFFMADFFRTKHHQPCIPHNNRFIIKFDLTKEIITPIQLPDHHRDQQLFLSCLADDQIALFIVNYQRSYPPTLFSDDYYTWVLLNENGGSSSSSVNKDCWIELHSFQIEAKSDERNIPRGISNDGKFAFIELNDSSGCKRIKLYHFASKQVKKTFPSSGSMMGKANVYRPSLVSIIGGKRAATEGVQESDRPK